MKKNIPLIALTLAASVLTLWAAPEPAAPDSENPSATEPQGPGHRGPHRRPPLVAALDANHDGVIDAQEIANAPAALKALDKNGDGVLNRDDLRPPRPEGEPPPEPRPPVNPRPGDHGPKGEKRPMAPLHFALDANHDRTIDAQEIANASAALKTLDKNGDGVLTRDEFMPKRPFGKGRGPHENPPGDKPEEAPAPSPTPAQ